MKYERKTCWKCNGSGKIDVWMGVMDYPERCDWCGGKGYEEFEIKEEKKPLNGITNCSCGSFTSNVVVNSYTYVNCVSNT